MSFKPFREMTRGEFERFIPDTARHDPEALEYLKVSPLARILVRWREMDRTGLSVLTLSALTGKSPRAVKRELLREGIRSGFCWQTDLQIWRAPWHLISPSSFNPRSIERPLNRFENQMISRYPDWKEMVTRKFRRPGKLGIIGATAWRELQEAFFLRELSDPPPVPETVVDEVERREREWNKSPEGQRFYKFVD